MIDEAAKKKIVDAIVNGIGKPKGGESSTSGDEHDGEMTDDEKPDEGLVAAMQELGQALSAKDYEKAATVFQNALTCNEE